MNIPKISAGSNPYSKVIHLMTIIIRLPNTATRQLGNGHPLFWVEFIFEGQDSEFVNSGFGWFGKVAFV